MRSVRARKLWAELGAARGRVAAMVLALAASLAGLGTVLGARTVLLREMTASYVGTHPADATLELDGDVDPAILAEVLARGDIATAAAREVLTARVRTADGVHGLLLFATDGDDRAPIHQQHVEAGAWPPPADAMLVERTALPVLGAALGDTVTITTPHGAPRPVHITGVVHDPALAPAWQEHRGYGYLTRAALTALGEPGALHQLSVRFAPAPTTQSDAEARATALATWLAQRGHAVHQVRVPPLGRHPHDGQMATLQMILLVFGALLVALSAIVIATSLAALLARQVREIGVMKTLGATAWQLAAIYAGFVAVIGGIALAIAAPLAYLGARGFVAGAGGMLNLAITDRAIGPGMMLLLAISGLLVPLAAAALPIARACRRSVRDALADHGARVRATPTWLPRAARDALRTPGRLALSLGLLAAAGALTMTAFNVKRAYEHDVERLPAMWHYDVDLRLADPAPVALAAQLAAVPGVRRVEPWGDATAAWPRPENIGETSAPDVVHSYPDQGHGRFHVFGVPPDTRLAQLPLVAGRWLRPDDTDAIVVSRGGTATLGQRITLSLDGHPATWTVVGIVDPMPLGSAFVLDRALAAATHATGTTLFRVAYTPGAQPLLPLTQVLQQAGAALAAVEPLTLLRAALDDHVVIVSRAAVVISGIMALVGLLGLTAALGIAVVERTSELGIWKAIGAGPARITRLILGEAIAIALASWLVAVALSIPATLHVDQLLGAQGFLAADFVISPLAMLAWLAIVVAGSVAASYLPARRAARLTVREALSAT